MKKKNKEYYKMTAECLDTIYKELSKLRQEHNHPNSQSFDNINQSINNISSECSFIHAVIFTLSKRIKK